MGKTTTLKSYAKGNYNYVTLDDLEQRQLAQKDPALFLQAHKPLVIIDEVQYAPQLFSYIKIAIDKAHEPGMFLLTGSQKFHLMRGITETMAGRIAILDMLGLSQAEINSRAYQVQPFLPTKEWIDSANGRTDLMAIYRNVWRGSYPRLVANSDTLREIFYNPYIQTYITRDVRDLAKVGDEGAFYKFLRSVAARTAQLVNYNELARDADIDPKTAKHWLSVLEASGIIYILQPYHTNVTKRLVKTPKLYFLDTGLCSYLTQWSTPETLEAGAMSVAIFETYAFSEILKSYWHNGLNPQLYFYRDRDQKEIDLLIEQNGYLHPIEFKKTATPSKNACKNFSVLDKLDKNIGAGAVICLKPEEIPLSKSITSIPIGYI